MLALSFRCAFAAACVAVAFALATHAAYAQPSASPPTLPTVSPSPIISASVAPSVSPIPSPQASASALPAAGVVPSDVTVELGGTVSPSFALARIAATIAAAAQLQPGATPNVTGVSISKSLQPGGSVEAIAHVTISGANLASVDGTTAVHLSVETLPELEPAFLFYSDDPERVNATSDGVLYRSVLGPNQAARIYAYHVSDAPNRHIWLALHVASASSVQVLGYAAGPADQYGYVGHISTLRYLLERNTQESFVLPVDAGSTALVQLGYRPLAATELVAAIYDLRVLAGGPVDVEVIATTGDADPRSYIAGAENPGDGHGRRGEFALADVPPIGFTYAAGDPEPSPFPVGLPTIRNLRPTGRPLGGDYGILRTVSLALSNPTSAPAQVYLYEQPSGGTVTATIWFAGDPAPIEVPCVHDADNRYLVKTIELSPGESRTLTGEYMTDGSSSYPLLFGVTMVPPSPPPGPYSPDACNPRTPPPATPPPTTSPGPGPSPSPEGSASPGTSPTP
jgi:hypothetical protein